MKAPGRKRGDVPRAPDRGHGTRPSRQEEEKAPAGPGAARPGRSLTPPPPPSFLLGTRAWLAIRPHVRACSELPVGPGYTHFAGEARGFSLSKVSSPGWVEPSAGSRCLRHLGQRVTWVWGHLTSSQDEGRRPCSQRAAERERGRGRGTRSRRSLRSLCLPISCRSSLTAPPLSVQLRQRRTHRRNPRTHGAWRQPRPGASRASRDVSPRVRGAAELRARPNDDFLVPSFLLHLLVAIPVQKKSFVFSSTNKRMNKFQYDSWSLLHSTSRDLLLSVDCDAETFPDRPGGGPASRLLCLRARSASGWGP